MRVQARVSRWLVILAAIACWLTLTALYGFLVLWATIVAFGREGNDYHLAGWLVAIVLWVAATMWAAGPLDDWLARTPNRAAD